MIEMREVTKVYTTGKVAVEALRGIDLRIEKNEFISIMGPSGSGKSTLMNIIGCLDTPTQGSYLLEGMKVADLDPNRLAEIRNKKIGFVFQNFNLLPYATAFENVEVPLIFKGESYKSRKKRGEELLERVGLKDRADHRPTELSGGEMQRVAIARSLANDPEIIFADEPTGNLDTATGEQILQLLVKLNEGGKTIIMVTHETNVAEHAKGRLHMLDGVVERIEGDE